MIRFLVTGVVVEIAVDCLLFCELFFLFDPELDLRPFDCLEPLVFVLEWSE